MNAKNIIFFLFCFPCVLFCAENELPIFYPNGIYLNTRQSMAEGEGHFNIDHVSECHDYKIIITGDMLSKKKQFVLSKLQAVDVAEMFENSFAQKKDVVDVMISYLDGCLHNYTAEITVSREQKNKLQKFLEEYRKEPLLHHYEKISNHTFMHPHELNEQFPRATLELHNQESILVLMKSQKKQGNSNVRGYSKQGLELSDKTMTYYLELYRAREKASHDQTIIITLADLKKPTGYMRVALTKVIDKRVVIELPWYKRSTLWILSGTVCLLCVLAYLRCYKTSHS